MGEEETPYDHSELCLKAKGVSGGAIGDGDSRVTGTHHDGSCKKADRTLLPVYIRRIDRVSPVIGV